MPELGPDEWAVIISLVALVLSTLVLTQPRGR